MKLKMFMLLPLASIVWANPDMQMMKDPHHKMDHQMSNHEMKDHNMEMSAHMSEMMSKSPNKQCTSSAKHYQAKNPSDEVNFLMHHPMMCTQWVESKNADVDYISNMIPHHKGAIASSKALLKYAKSPELIEIAKNIIAAQEKEVKDFQALLPKLKKLKQTESKSYQQFAQKAKMDMKDMMHKMHHSGDHVEKDYITAMIAHHEGAIKASEQILTISKSPDVKKIAQNIINDQKQEVEKFKELLNHY